MKDSTVPVKLLNIICNLTGAFGNDAGRAMAGRRQGQSLKGWIWLDG